MAAGAGEYLIATMTTVVTLIVLAVVGPLERYLEERVKR
jgi:uncharacterized membrane protein YhiD involved in acid resistance